MLRRQTTARRSGALSLNRMAARASERRRRRYASDEFARVLRTTDARHRLELETLLADR